MNYIEKLDRLLENVYRIADEYSNKDLLWVVAKDVNSADKLAKKHLSNKDYIIKRQSGMDEEHLKRNKIKYKK